MSSETTYLPFCVYFIHYHGKQNIPPFYIGSTSVAKLMKGYRGSVSSAQFKQLWHSEVLSSPDSFTVYYVSLHETRKEAILEEGRLQDCYDAAHNPLFVNKRNVGGLFIVDQHSVEKVIASKRRNGSFKTGARKAADTRRRNGTTGLGIPKSADHASKIAASTTGKHKHALFMRLNDVDEIESESDLVSNRHQRIADGWVCFNKDGTVWEPPPRPYKGLSNAWRHSDEAKQKLSAAALNRPKMLCPHCGKLKRLSEAQMKEHLSKCELNIQIKRQRDQVSTRPKSPCPYCGQLFYNNTLQSHYRACAVRRA